MLGNQVRNENAERDPDKSNRAHNYRTVTVAVSVLTALAGLGILLLGSENPAWQLSVLVCLYFACSVVGIFSLTYLYPKGAFLTGILLLSLFLGICMMTTSASLSGLGFPSAIIYLIFILSVSSTISKPRQGNLLAAAGIIIASVTALLSEFSPIHQISNHLAQVVTPAVLVALLITYLILLLNQSVSTTLRTRLITILIALVIIPLAILSVYQSKFLFNVLNDETNRLLLVTAEQTALGLDDFLSSEKKAIAESAKTKAFVNYLELSPDQRKDSPEEQAVKLAMSVLDTNKIAEAGELSSYALLDIHGVNLFDSLLDMSGSEITPVSLLSIGIDPETINHGQRLDESAQLYFQIPAESGVVYLSPLHMPNSTRSFFYLSSPVRNQGNKVIGVLRRRYDGIILQQKIMAKINLLGKNSYPILFDENNIRLADTFTPQYIYKAVAPLSSADIKLLKTNRRLPDLPDRMLSTNYPEFNQMLNGFETRAIFTTEISTAYETNSLKEIGAIARLKNMPWKLVYLQTDYSDQALRSQQSKLTTLITAIVGCLIGLMAIAAAHYLSNPIVQLTKIAQLISMGDLDAQAPANRSDEFGKLGRAFNLMTGQMRELISTLEERVKVRTKEIASQNEALSYRARQLETVSDVARQIVTTQDLEALLSSVTRLISERFGYYHVGIFLIDQNKEYAVLRAANSEGGQRMLSRQHKLPVGKVGIVGYVTGTGQARIATDVGKDAVFFNNPDLPATRSEMALPLAVNNNIIGAIDIQSTDPDAFSTEDIELFNTLAYQVAIAIYNNQLFGETLKALEESQRLHRQYLQSEWAKETVHRKTLGYLFNQKGISPQQAENPLWEEVFSTGKALYTQQTSDNGKADQVVMAIPVTIRGETIGVIHVQDHEQGRTWSQDEKSMVNTIASQVATALENARLFENVVRRADREKKALEITARIRSTNNPGEMMQIAVRELQQTLGATRTQIYIRRSEQDIEENFLQKNGSSSEKGSNV